MEGKNLSFKDTVEVKFTFVFDKEKFKRDLIDCLIIAYYLIKAYSEALDKNYQRFRAKSKIPRVSKLETKKITFFFLALTLSFFQLYYFIFRILSPYNLNFLSTTHLLIIIFFIWIGYIVYLGFWLTLSSIVSAKYMLKSFLVTTFQSLQAVFQFFSSLF